MSTACLKEGKDGLGQFMRRLSIHITKVEALVEREATNDWLDTSHMQRARQLSSHVLSHHLYARWLRFCPCLNSASFGSTAKDDRFVCLLPIDDE